MQQIIVDLIAIAALLSLARMTYKNFVAARKSDEPGCPGCGNCDAAKNAENTRAAAIKQSK